MLHRYFDEDFKERVQRKGVLEDTLKKKWAWLMLGEKLAKDYRGEDFSDPEERTAFFDAFYRRHTKGE